MWVYDNFTTNAFTQLLAGADYYFADKRKLLTLKSEFEVSKIKNSPKQYPESPSNGIIPSAKEYYQCLRRFIREKNI